MNKRPPWKDDLLKEKSLWEVYSLSRKFPKQKGNRAVLWVGSFISFSLPILFLYLNYNSFNVEILIFAMIGFALPLCVSVLGFLIAGFSIFAVVSDSRILTAFAQTDYHDTPFSIFKIIFYNFLSVFFVFLVLLSMTGILIFFLSLPGSLVLKEIGIRGWFELSKVINVLVAGLFSSSIIFALIKLKSFIWSVYQGFILIIVSRDVIPHD